MAKKLHTGGAVLPSLTVEDVHAALSLTTWAPTQLQARNALGWTGPQWERWCVTLLTNALLGGGDPAAL